MKDLNFKTKDGEIKIINHMDGHYNISCYTTPHLARIRAEGCPDQSAMGPRDVFISKDELLEFARYIIESLA